MTFEEIPQRITCPHCNYPMRILSVKDDVYQCYCADCGQDRYMKKTN